MQVKKRDGRIIDFDKEKIYNAILAAMKSVDEINTRTASRIANEIQKEATDMMGIEEIQDIVENKLMASSLKNVAKAYILYREKRSSIRNWNSKLMQEAQEKLLACKIEHQNANVDEHSFGGRRGEADAVWMKQFALDNCMSAKARENHINNRIYIHDLNEYPLGSHNCLTLPFDDLLAKGFDTRQTDVRPTGAIETACQLLAVIFQLQSLVQFGGASASHLDWTLIPYIRKSFYKHFKDGLKYIEEIEYKEEFGHFKQDDDDIRLKTIYPYTQAKKLIIANEDTYFFNNMDINRFKSEKHKKTYRYALDLTLRELAQAVEGLFHNLNTLQSRSGNQLPFTSVNYGSCTLDEGRMVIKAMLEGSIAGVGKFHKTPIFPCCILQLGKGINRHPGDPNYDLFRLALKATAKRLYPNYGNLDWSGNAGYDKNDPRTYFSTMGKRKLSSCKIF